MTKKKKHKIKDKEQGANKPNGALASKESDRINVLNRPVGDDTPSDSPAPNVPHESNNKKSLDNIKFVAYVLSMIVTLFVALTNYMPYFESRRGKFVAKVHGKEVASPEAHISLVYMDEDSIDLANFDFFPNITNPSKYPLKDVLVKYTVSPDIPGVSITDYYDAHKIRQSLEVTNKDNKEVTLHPTIPMPSPFSHFVMKDNEQATISLQATYKRMKEPFVYKTHIYTKKIVEENESNRVNSIYDNVEHFCFSNNIDTCDIFIVDSGTMFKHEFIWQEISSDNDTIKENEIRDKDGKPWYMYLIGILLFGIYCLGTAIVLFPILIYNRRHCLTFKSLGMFFTYKSPKTILSFFGIRILGAFISVVAIYYTFTIFSDFSGMFFKVFVLGYFAFFSFDLASLMVGELFKNRTKNFPRFLVTLLFWLVLFVCFNFIIYLMHYFENF